MSLNKENQTKPNQTKIVFQFAIMPHTHTHTHTQNWPWLISVLDFST